ncbi:dephospho-CoA kinase [Solemya velesiana gill symbiont]|uniref:Dephospho-CoA kinase n=1 Tax=Solemya velesiana gill symbiont TaxID=1918948 RepID=A0A1T2KWT2_9GAMM|nr:dephospho-CoA kinase [Solemya velesiana gill symbiont]OOZ37303.1 dephospho-CoA kinase [Solemya velesiana gill symbiont]
MFTVGLTGGIGSGKSAVSGLFSELGVPVTDADEVAREVVEPGQPVLATLEKRFGPQILDVEGRLQRKVLRELVFNDERARKDLEAILHPLIRQRIRQHLANVEYPYAILSIPLLVETGQSSQVDQVLVVDCPVDLQIRRICQRDGITTEQAQAILAAQASREERLKAADDIIENTGEIGRLKPKVLSLHHRYLELAEQPSQP